MTVNFTSHNYHSLSHTSHQLNSHSDTLHTYWCTSETTEHEPAMNLNSKGHSCTARWPLWNVDLSFHVKHFYRIVSYLGNYKQILQKIQHFHWWYAFDNMRRV